MSAALPIAGAALSVYGDVQQGKMTSDTLNNQADNLTQQAAEAEQKGQYDAMREQMLATQKIGTATAAYGASGVAANSGSVLDVVQASHQNSEMDRMNILHGADIRAINYSNQASMDRFGGQSAIMGSYWKALGDASQGLVKTDQSGARPQTTGTTGGVGNGEAAASSEDMAGADTGAAAAGVA